MKLEQSASCFAWLLGVGFFITTWFGNLQAEGIPEPPVIIYGRVIDPAFGALVTEGSLEWTYRDASTGAENVLNIALSNINDQFSYIISVPCESLLSGMTPSEGVIAIKSTATTYDRGLAFWGDEQLQLVNPAQSAFGVSPAIRGRVERVDFQLSSLQPDQDGDGLPDWWELLYPTASEPGADTDEDGLNNLAEFIAGTNPADRNSKLALSNTLAESDGSKSVRIVWRGVPGRSYRVLRAPLLSASPGDYEVVASREATAEGDMIYEDAPSAGHYFYRVEVVLP